MKEYRDIFSVMSTQRNKGIKKGELKKQFEIAKNLLMLNIDIAIISQTIGLSIDEIKKNK